MGYVARRPARARAHHQVLPYPQSGPTVGVTMSSSWMRCGLAMLCGAVGCAPTGRGAATPAKHLVVLCSEGVASCTERTDYPVDSPADGTVLVVGDQVAVRWHGGTPEDLVDVVFVPVSGDATVLARRLANTGSAQVDVHALSTAAGSMESTSGGRLAKRLAQGFTSAAAVGMASFAAFESDGAHVVYSWLDPVTGDQRTLGTVGDLDSFSPDAAALDDVTHELFVLEKASIGARTQRIYTLDARTGALLRTADVALRESEYVFLPVVASGHRVLVTHWDAQTYEQHWAELDTTSGQFTLLGPLPDRRPGDSYATASDPSTNTVWFFESQSFFGDYWVWESDDRTGAVRASWPLCKGMPIRPSGLTHFEGSTFFSFDFDGLVNRPFIFRIDASAQSCTRLGPVGDLAGWSVVAATNATTRELLVVVQAVQPGRQTTKLYVLSADTGALLRELPASTLPPVGLLVRW